MEVISKQSNQVIDPLLEDGQTPLYLTVTTEYIQAVISAFKVWCEPSDRKCQEDINEVGSGKEGKYSHIPAPVRKGSRVSGIVFGLKTRIA